MRRLLFVATVATAFAFCGTATASPFGIALHDAEQYWGGEAPCHGRVAFEAGVYPSATEWAASMWATWSDGVEGVEWAWREGPQFNAANFTGCVIHYSAAAWPPARMVGDWPAFAYSIAHEVEHFKNLWQLETAADNGTLPECAVSRNAVNLPFFDGYNEPWSAVRHRPRGAPARVDPRLMGQSSC